MAACLKEIEQAASRGADLIRRMLAFGAHGPDASRPLALHVWLKDTIPTVRRLLPETIDVQLVIEPDLPHVLGDTSVARFCEVSP